ncbi:MAG: acyltransferase [Clostridia bacterium]|nr:acyltransferase [Clostridia bacterium]
MENKRVDVSISIIRLISLILIISCHILQGLKLEAAYWVNIGVQMFFFLSGFLYGLKDISDVREFYKKRLKRIMIPYLIIFLIMLFLEYKLKSKKYDINIILANLVGLQSFFGRIKTLTHTWFISYILICYAITPLLQKIEFKNITNFQFIKKMFLVCLFISILSYFKVTYIIAPWICNYIIGYFYSRYYKKYEKKDIKFSVIFLTFTIVFLVFRVGVQYKLFNINWPKAIIKNTTLIKQWSHVLLGCSICIWLYKALSKIKIKYNFIIRFFDKISFHVYLVHQIFILNYFSLLELSKNLVLNIVIIFIASIISGVSLYFMQKLVDKLLEIIKLRRRKCVI